ncbi:MAG: hypothetical protein BRC41_09295, partial [Cyanobacteria bacterium QH_9_48_43]
MSEADRSADELPVGERADGPFREMVELMEQPLLQVLQRREVASPEAVPELLPETLDGTPLGTSRRLKHRHEAGGPLQLGRDVSPRLVQLQQVEAVLEVASPPVQKA